MQLDKFVILFLLGKRRIRSRKSYFHVCVKVGKRKEKALYTTLEHATLLHFWEMRLFR